MQSHWQMVTFFIMQSICMCTGSDWLKHPNVRFCLQNLAHGRILLQTVRPLPGESFYAEIVGFKFITPACRHACDLLMGTLLQQTTVADMFSPRLRTNECELDLIDMKLFISIRCTSSQCPLKANALKSCYTLI
mmetsp:Transcript_15897/g.45708  ORF Transcript_15897/g.45708 Transcript_15897/m.45708 type:complete len:134 (+) Transcript_15897:157-558(+)